MLKAGVSQIHIIPFDLGYVFYDYLNIDNTKNLQFAHSFIQALTEKYAGHESVKIYDNFSVQYGGKKIIKVRYNKKEIADQAICIARLTNNLYCYILSNGIGVFVFADLCADALKNVVNDISKYSRALSAKVQKNLTQSTILNRYNGEDVFPIEEELMLQFRIVCWEVINHVAKKQHMKISRKLSSNINYKTEGLSYVLSVYVLKERELTDSEINYLLYSPISKHITEKDNWDKVQKTINEHDGKNKETVLITPHGKLHFSWSAVAAIISNDINSYEEIVTSSELNTLIKTEIYVQSRWFIADNSMDNVNKSYNCKLEELQRIESMMEFYQSELDNEISANMNTLYKNTLDYVVETSSVKSLYKSVLGQIKTQRKIKEAREQDRKKRNRFLANLFLAVFTASSFFKTILDVISKDFSALNIWLFAGTMVLAIGTVIFDYFNK